MLLTIAQVADRLQCSRGHVHNLINARGYTDALTFSPASRARSSRSQVSSAAQ